MGILSRIIGFGISIVIVYVLARWLLGPQPGVIVAAVAAVALVIDLIRRPTMRR